MIYQLTVRQLDQTCLFELTWGQRRLEAQLEFPARLLQAYQVWQRAYLGYYKQALRGRIAASGQVIALDVDWQSRLVQSEARILLEFHNWLRHGDLYDLRQVVSRASREVAAQSSSTDKLNLFLSCTPMAIARLPWETWEFDGPVQIVRSPVNIQAENQRQSRHRSQPRVLAILGDETGLNFAGERAALNAHRQLDVQYVGWQPDIDVAALREKICHAIADPAGWDVLFFAGHSNEQDLVAGQIAIAPKKYLSIRELSPYLSQAQQQGLQFALFNSCSGLDIANALINLGLGQVAIMREPIHNQVAHVFLEQFLLRLARYEDVESALGGVCRFLKTQKDLTYPSAHLVPSLFRHPYSVPYRIQPNGWRHRLRQLRPRRREAIAAAALLLVSLTPLISNRLVDQRVYLQAVYRSVTGQTPEPSARPVVLAQIDQRTFREFELERIDVIDRALMADLVNQLSDLKATVIGIDYIFDLSQPEHDPQLKAALRRTVEENRAWPILATVKNSGGDWFEANPALQSPWLTYGDAWVPMWHIRPWRDSVNDKLPFSVQLAIARRIQASEEPGLPPLTPEFLQARQRAQAEALDAGLLSPRAELTPLTAVSYRFRQRWLQPLIDFSIPAEQTYRVVPAWRLLQSPEAVLKDLKVESLDNAVVIIAAGYDKSFDGEDSDNFPLPPAMRYWFQRSGNPSAKLSGGEAHAYMTHQLLSDRLVVPIPDVWLVLAAALVGQTLTAYLVNLPKLNSLIFGGGLSAVTVGYGLFSLQLYVSGALLLPWLLPSLTVWCYVLPKLVENYRDQQ